MAIRANEVISVIENWAPPALAESYDNPGLLVGNPNQEVTGILINLDATMPVLDEAIESATAKPDACLILQRDAHPCALTAGRDHDYAQLVDAACLNRAGETFAAQTQPR